MTVFRLLMLGLAFLLAVPAANAGAQESTEALEQTIQYLIDHVERSELTFVRNTKEYSSAEAAEHMGKKYRHFKKKIHTAEDFIELAATKSLMSGKPYLVVTAHGERLRTADWLQQVLVEYRARQAAALYPGL